MRSHTLILVPYSGGSSVEGHFSAPHGGISVDFMNMNKVIEFRAEEYVISKTDMAKLCLTDTDASQAWI